jgi:D-3-phosphoglycerate dehydrogenase
VSTRPTRILNTEPGRLDTAARAALRSLGDVEEHEADRAYLVDRTAEFDVFFIGLRNVIDTCVLDRAARLRCIATPTTGTDHIDMATARARGVTVLSLAGETRFLQTITATAEHTWALLLSLVRRVPAAHRSVLEGRWTRDAFGGTELRGKTLGIVGYGRLGRMVAAYGQAFGMTVIAFDRTPDAGADVEFVGVDELLRRADVVSVHLSLVPETDNFLDATRLRQMKRGALLVNTARGRIVDETALLEGLRAGRIGGAAVDVLADETSADERWIERNALRAYAAARDNLIITPHVGGLTSESAERTNMFMIEKLARHLDAGRTAE